MSGEFEELVNRENSGFLEVVKQVFDSLPVETPESQALEQALLKLAEHNGELAKLIGRGLLEGNAASEAVWPTIHTVLAPGNMARELATLGFQAVPGAGAPRGIKHRLLDKNAPAVARPMAFLRCPLAEFESHCHSVRKGVQNGVGFEYKLVPAYGLIAVEKILRKFALLYHVEKPLIFSPWARRAVHIDFLNNFTPAEGSRIDLRPAANDLAGILLQDWRLFWNASLERLENKSGQNSRPTPERPFYTALYNEGISGNVFVCPVDLAGQPPDRLATRRERDGIRIESPEKCGDIYERLEITPVDMARAPKDLQYFSNDCDAAVLAEAQRLRTAGEINRALHALATSAYSGWYLPAGHAGRPVVPYNSRQKYPANANEAIFANFKSRPEICVGLATTSANPLNALFVDDYGNYLLAFLRERYPEYAWKGFVMPEGEEKR